MILSKLSIAIFLARIVVAKIYRWILYATMVISVVTGLGFFFVMLFQCQPVEYFWERKPGVDGQCMPVDVIIIVTYVYSGLNILCDFTLALLPVTIVWSLHMPLKMKLATFSLLSMGCIASTGVVLRLRFVQNYRDADFLCKSYSSLALSHSHGRSTAPPTHQSIHMVSSYLPGS